LGNWSNISDIPLIVHYIFKDPLVPSQYLPLIETCVLLNPRFTFLFWTDEKFEEFVQSSFPSDLIKLYKRYSNGIEKADVSRYFILYNFGGIYLDLDVQCIQPMDKSGLQNYSAVLTQEPLIQTRLVWDHEFCCMNDIMMFKPKHPFLMHVIKQLESSIHQSHPVFKTGPVFITKAFKSFTPQNKFEAVHLAPNNVFNPLWDITQIEPMRKKCASPLTLWHKVACDDWSKSNYAAVDERKLVAKAVLVHRFLHLGYQWAHGLITKRFNILEKFPSMLTYSKNMIITAKLT